MILRQLTSTPVPAPEPDIQSMISVVQVVVVVEVVVVVQVVVVILVVVVVAVVVIVYTITFFDPVPAPNRTSKMNWQ